MLNFVQYDRVIDRFEDWAENKGYVKTGRIWYQTCKRALAWYKKWCKCTQDEKRDIVEILEHHQSLFTKLSMEKKVNVIRLTALGQFWIHPLNAFIKDNKLDRKALGHDGINEKIYEAFGRDFRVDKRRGVIIANNPFEDESDS